MAANVDVKCGGNLLGAPRRNRMRNSSDSTQSGAFSGWRAIILVNNKTKAAVFKRLLEAGGAMTFSYKPPFSSMTIRKSAITHAFVDVTNKESARPLQEIGIPCLLPEYIGDYIIRDPAPDPREFFIDREAKSVAKLIENHASCSANDNINMSPVVVSSQRQSLLPEVKMNSNGRGQKSGNPSAKRSGAKRKILQNSTPKNGRNLFDYFPSVGKTAKSVAIADSNAKIVDSATSADSTATSVNSNWKILKSATSANSNIEIVKSVTSVNSDRKIVDSTTSADSNAKIVKSATSINSNRGNLKSATSVNSNTKIVKSLPPADSNVKIVKSLPPADSNVKIVKSATSADSNAQNMQSATGTCGKSGHLSKASQQAMKSPVGNNSGLVDLTQESTSDDSDIAIISVRPGKDNCRNAIHSDYYPSAAIEVQQIRRSRRHIVKKHACTDNCCSATPKKDAQELCGNLRETVKSECLEVIKKEPSDDRRAPYSDDGTEVATKNEVLKRRFKRDEEDKNVSNKRRKLCQDPCCWKPMNIVNVNKLSSPKTDDVAVIQLSNTMTSIFDTCVEEQHHHLAVDSLLSAISSTRYPQPCTLNVLMTKILLLSTDSSKSMTAYSTLQRILAIHPPRNLALLECFQQSLCVDGKVTLNRGQEWILVKEVISQSVQNVKSAPIKNETDSDDESMDDDDTKEEISPGVRARNNKLLLKFLVSLFQENARYYFHNTEKKVFPCLLGTIIWPGCQPGQTVNNHCKQLLDLLVEAISNEAEQEVIQMIQCMVGILSQCFLQADKLTAGSIDLGHRTSSFVHELSNRMMGEWHLKPELMIKFLQTLSNPHLTMHVARVTLETMDDSIVKIIPDQPLDLEKIITQYLFVLPKLIGGPMSPHKPKRPARSRKDKRALKVIAHSNTLLVKTKEKPDAKNSPQKKVAIINKRNAKGETKLHVACRRNNFCKVKELLTIPGIDINAKDNAGWTPLHEACNHGSTECVKLLLNFKPHKTINCYFKNNNNNDKFTGMVDLLACNDENVTPLHDAVLNNRVEVARLLIKRGGSLLLQAKTILNYTPLDLAESEQMQQVLLNPSQGFSQISNSQSSSISESGDMTLDSSLLHETAIETAYADVLGSGVFRRFAGEHECNKLVVLVFNMLKSYLVCRDATRADADRRNTTAASMKRSLEAFDEHLKQLSQDGKGLEKWPVIRYQWSCIVDL
ncbi:uncharacterized protein LOC141899964 isoform X2 [Tubulanus polymorphus]